MPTWLVTLVVCRLVCSLYLYLGLQAEAAWDAKITWTMRQVVRLSWRKLGLAGRAHARHVLWRLVLAGGPGSTQSRRIQLLANINQPETRQLLSLAR